MEYLAPICQTNETYWSLLPCIGHFNQEISAFNEHVQKPLHSLIESICAGAGFKPHSRSGRTVGAECIREKEYAYDGDTDAHRSFLEDVFCATPFRESLLTLVTYFVSMDLSSP